MDSSLFPTHIAFVVRRLKIAGLDASADTFLHASYLAEIIIKTITTTLYTALKEGSPDDAYRMAHELIKADGLGVWDTAIRQCTNIPLSGYLPREFQSLIVWATKKRNKPEDEWFRKAKDAVIEIFKALDSDDESIEKISTARDLITALVRIRNKTKAHGAVGLDFFSKANTPYLESIQLLGEHCPALQWKWFYVDFLANKEPRIVKLFGADPSLLKGDDIFRSKITGIYIIPENSSKEFLVTDLLRTNKECTDFFFPNGGINSEGQAEYLDYATGKITKIDMRIFSVPPPPLPPSETQGLDLLDIQSNVFGNLPLVPKGYVERKTLQQQLEERLLDRNHAIITLHGRGGAGKTSLALFVAHKLAAENIPHFDQIIWFSARDVDLRANGPSPVHPAVLDLAAVSKAYGKLLEEDLPLEGFSKILQGEDLGKSQRGTLFVFDNFETMSDVRQIHEFLDTHTFLPNKVLITSRERAFKADYPIEVKGMEFNEAKEMLIELANELHIQGLVDDKVIRNIYDFSEGHAYVMRVLIGEIEKGGRYVPANQVIAKRIDIVDAVFERSFNKLSESGRYIFLAISNWRSSVSELALLVVLGQHGLDVEGGIEECKRLSLITEDALIDHQPCYYAPQLARVFGRKKLEGDSDRLLIQEDLETIRKFGVLDIQRGGKMAQDEQIEKFAKWCISDEVNDPAQVERLDKILLATANLWSPTWVDLANFRRKHNGDVKDIEYAYRRAVEEMPFRQDVWYERAKYAEFCGNEPLQITSLVSAVEADPSNLDLISQVAFQLCRYINEHKTDIPKTRRGVYLASVRSHMEKVSKKLDATGLSRLAWLFLLESDEKNALKYASLGAEKDPENIYCARIVQGLDNKSQNHLETRDLI